MKSARQHAPSPTLPARPGRLSGRPWAVIGATLAALSGTALPGLAASVSLPLSSRLTENAAEYNAPARALLSAAVRVGDPAPPAAAPLAAQPWDVPLAFEPADERAPRDADYSARGPGYAVFVSSGNALLVLPSATAPARETSAERKAAPAARRANATSATSRSGGRLVRMRWEGSHAERDALPEGPLTGRIHRLRGSDPRHWQTGLQPHGRIRYRNLYPGIDIAFYGHGRELEYDLLLAPGANPAALRQRFDGVRALRLDEGGALRLETGAGELIQGRPVAYQENARGRTTVAAAYRLETDGTIGIALGDYDPARPVVIDPVLSYATFLGGTGFDQCWDVAADATGAAFVVGETESVSYAGLRILDTNTFQPTYAGGLANVAGDAFVAKLNPTGTAVEWFTYLGGNDLESAFTLALTATGEPVLGGFTTSTNFPLSVTAYQTNLPGPTNKYTGRAPLQAFVSRLTADGSGLVASTLLGGENEDQVLDLALLPDGSVVAVGSTTSTNFPTTTGAAQRDYAGGTDAFVAVLSPDLATLSAATLLGGTGRDSAEGVALAPLLGTAHVVGITASTNLPVRAPIQGALGGSSDAWVAGFSLPDLTPTYATYLGGFYDDFAYRAAPTPSGGVWFVGETGSTNFPVAAALQSTNAGVIDGFIARLSPDGQTLEMATYLGGSFADALWDVAADATGGIHLTGLSESTSIPGLSAQSVQSTNAGLQDILIAHLAADGTLTSSFYGSAGDELGYGLALDGAGGVYVAGRARSVVFPVSSTNVAQPNFGGDRADGFVLKLATAPALTAARTAVGVEVSWPAPNPEFVLESTPAENGQATTWARETHPVALVAGRHVVRLPTSATNCLFRLRWER